MKLDQSVQQDGSAVRVSVRDMDRGLSLYLPVTDRTLLPVHPRLRFGLDLTNTGKAATFLRIHISNLDGRAENVRLDRPNDPNSRSLKDGWQVEGGQSLLVSAFMSGDNQGLSFVVDPYNSIGAIRATQISIYEQPVDGDAITIVHFTLTPRVEAAKMMREAEYKFTGDWSFGA